MKTLVALLVSMLLVCQTLPLAADEGLTNGITVQLTPETLARLRQQYRDPFLAGLLSGLYWGLGHFYTKDYTSGSLFMFGDLVFKGLAVGLVLKLKNKYTGDGDDQIRWREMNGTDRSLVIGAIAVWAGVTILSVADAASSANEYNMKNDPLSRFDLGFSAREGAPFVSLGLKMPF
ncbi:MAG TPA: hypothetical protein PLD82_06300 [Spirochaetota bacterium]|nr:hypothetical protein [Spirochaetota bacterium]